MVEEGVKKLCNLTDYQVNEWWSPEHDTDSDSERGTKKVGLYYMRPTPPPLSRLFLDGWLTTLFSTVWLHAVTSCKCTVSLLSGHIGCTSIYLTMHSLSFGQLHWSRPVPHRT